jgi:TolB-like protein/Tfp pilus assembly protein PilF
MSQSTISRIYGDLSRRKVFRATALYGVVAWFAIQVAEATFEPLNLPEGAYRLVVILALVGFPIVIIVAWAYDFTRRGFVRTAPVAAANPVGWHQRIIDFVIIGVLAALVVYSGCARGRRRVGAGGGTLRSIAVLPFDDFSENRDQAYLGDGIAEELLNALVGVDGLRVAARTSSFAFRGAQKDVRKIGQELAVDTVLEGSVRRSGDRVKITAQLIDTKDGYHLWSEVYDKQLTDIFAVQESISRSIADELKLRLGDAATQRLANSPTNIRAYDKYLEGRKKWNERTRASLEQARELFTEAVKLDPNYAPAYSGLADTYLLLSEAQYGTLTAEEVLQHAEPAIGRALELNGGLAEAYASLGLLRWSVGEMDFAQLALRKALELNPSYSMAHFWLGSVLLEAGGTLSEATAEYREAYSRDPYHGAIAINYASALAQLGEDEEARQVALRLSARYPDSPKPCAALADLAEKAGRLDEAVYWVLRAEQMPGNDGTAGALLAKLYGELGDMHRAREALARIPADTASEGYTLQIQAFMAILEKDWDRLSQLVDPLVRRRARRSRAATSPRGVARPCSSAAWRSSPAGKPALRSSASSASTSTHKATASSVGQATASPRATGGRSHWSARAAPKTRERCSSARCRSQAKRALPAGASVRSAFRWQRPMFCWAAATRRSRRSTRRYGPASCRSGTWIPYRRSRRSAAILRSKKC